jgi:tetratricopeptide (TPR) repeat protein
MPSVIALEQSYNRAANNCNLGIAYLYQGKLKPAEKAFKETINIHPQHVEAYSNLGLVYSKQGKSKEAESSYLKALEIEPNRLEALTNLAYLYLRSGNMSEAERFFLRASELEPAAVDIHLALANIYAQRQEFTSVQKQYDEIISNHSELAIKESENVNLNDKEISMPQSRFSECHTIKSHETITSLAEALCYMGKQLVAKNRIAEAILAFRVALAIKPEFVEVLEGLAEIYQQARNYKQAIEVYEAILHAEPENYSAFYQLGECYQSIGASQAAHFCYLQALELNPDYEPAWQRVMNNKQMVS